jgi:hypothetical protein
MPTGAYWRCKEKHRHRQRLAASHLRLPKMRELIPKRDLAKLEQQFGRARAGQQLGLL